MAENAFPSLMTAREAADFLRVSVEAISVWAREGKLLAAARTENGEPLFYRWRVARDGPPLAVEEPLRIIREPSARSLRKREALLFHPRSLPCGCTSVVTDGESVHEPVYLCRTARALESAANLAQAFAAVAPHDPFFRRLARITAEAVLAHLAEAAGTASAHPHSAPSEAEETPRPALRKAASIEMTMP